MMRLHDEIINARILRIDDKDISYPALLLKDEVKGDKVAVIKIIGIPYLIFIDHATGFPLKNIKDENIPSDIFGIDSTFEDIEKTLIDLYHQEIEEMYASWKPCFKDFETINYPVSER